MNHKYPLALLTVVFAVLACGLPGAAPAPTMAPLPATPAFLPTQFVPSAPAPPTPAPAAGDFTGKWTGPDPDDGSSMTFTLVQTGNSLAGSYADTYSGTITPPGFNGTVTGSVLSPTSAQVTLNLSRHDGVTLVLQANLALTDPNTLTATVTSAGARMWTLKRQ